MSGWGKTWFLDLSNPFYDQNGFTPTKKRRLPATMDSFIYRYENEEEFAYRLRLWTSRELWDYIQIDWKEENMPNEMACKMLEFKQRVYAKTEAEIDEDTASYRSYMKTTTFEGVPHEYVWCQMYLIHLADRKNELQMEVAMDSLMM